MGPALDVAYAHSLQQYPRLKDYLSRQRINRPEIATCSDGETEALAKYLFNTVDNSTKLPILISPGEHR